MHRVDGQKGIVASVLSGAVGVLDGWDLLCLLGLAMAAVGLGLWFTPAVGLTVTGAAVLALGVAGSLQKARADAREAAAAARAERGRTG